MHYDPAFDLRYLPVFLAVCETGRVGTAAQLLNKSQPAVSYQIHQLEEQLGAALFERVGRTLTLTPAGKALHEWAGRTAVEFQGLAASITERTVERRQPLRVAAVSGFGRYVLFPRLRRLLRSEAGRHLLVELFFPTAEEAYGRVASGRADLAIVYVPKVSSRLLLERVCREELVLITPRQAKLLGVPRRRLTTLAGLAEAPFVTYEESDYVFGKWFQAVFGAPPRTLQGRHHLEELEEVVDLVAAGEGVSIVPADAVRKGAEVSIVRTTRRCFNDIYAATRPQTARARDIEMILRPLRAISV